MGGRAGIRTEKQQALQAAINPRWKQLHTKAEIEHNMTQKSESLKLNALAQFQANIIPLGNQLESSTCHQTSTYCYCCCCRCCCCCQSCANSRPLLSMKKRGISTPMKATCLHQILNPGRHPRKKTKGFNKRLQCLQHSCNLKRASLFNGRC